MKIEYNYSQTFELILVDMYNYMITFKTNNNMGLFDWEEEKTGMFKVQFESVHELQNIIKILDDYLKSNNLLYERVCF